MLREAYLGLLVFFGAGLCGLLRHTINRLTPLIFAGSFPLATLLINISGSLCMGFLVGWFGLRGQQTHQDLRLVARFGGIVILQIANAFLMRHEPVQNANGHHLGERGVVESEDERAPTAPERYVA